MLPWRRSADAHQRTAGAEDLGRLRPLAELPEDDYLAQLHVQLATERLLERMIGRMLDVNYHIAVETGGTAPRDFFESFLRMAETKVLPPGCAIALPTSATCGGSWIRSRSW